MLIDKINVLCQLVRYVIYSIYELNKERRFLSEYKNVGKNVPPFFEEKKEFLNTIQKECSSRVAFVSILPPEDSGIANYSFNIFANKDIKNPIDIYCPIKNFREHIRNKGLIKNRFVHIYTLDNFFKFNEIQAYEKIVIAVGGSFHHYYVFDFIRELNERNMLGKTAVYLHDILLRHFFRYYSNLSLFNHALIECELYNPELAKNCTWFLKWLKILKHSQYALNYGLRFFQWMGINHFVVNSLAAKQLLEKDLDSSRGFSIQTLFLPVISTSSAKETVLQKENGYTYIGSFGIPGPGKCTEQIIRSIKELNKKGEKIKLVIAGWRAKTYLKTLGYSDDFLISYDSLDESQLQSLMSQVDLAIQLRAMNGGESSGCVPMLLYAGTPTIVSNLGSFSEYGRAVIKFNGNPNFELVEFISSILKLHNLDDIKQEMQSYVTSHQPQQFASELYFMPFDVKSNQVKSN